MGGGVGGRVLHLGDDPGSATVVAERLDAESALSIVAETTLDGGIERLEVDVFHCLLYDSRSPEADVPTVVGRIRDAHPDVPIVLLTGSDTVASEAISAGATDYVRTDADGPRFDLLANRVETAVEKYRAERTLRDERRRNDEFVRLVAHDLRNPMAVTRGWIEVLHDDGGDVPYRKAVDALHRMDEIVDNLETLARSDEARAVDERVELSSVATAAWELIEADDADLHVEYGPEVRADVSMLQQILENLFTNAVEHGGDDVTVDVGTTEDGFFVADDGQGIDPEERERIFESGYTGDGGSGLGLAIVGHIADAHGWRVGVSEREEGGARFDFADVELELPREAFR